MHEMPDPGSLSKDQHPFFTRAAAILAGLASGIVAAVKVRDWSFRDFVRKGRSEEVSDIAVVSAHQKVENDLDALSKLSPASKEYAQADVGLKKILNDRKLFEAGQKGLEEKRTTLLKQAEKYAAVPEKHQQEITNAFNFFRRELEELRVKMDKSLNSKIARELQLKLRHSKHKPLIFATGAATAVAVGALAYLGMKKLVNPRQESAQAAIEQQRDALNANPAAARA
jgi:hypothetical protein